MRLTQTLPVLFASEPSGSLARPDAWRAASRGLSRVIALVRNLGRTETDHSRLSTHMLCDIGLVPGEPPYVGAWDHSRMDYRL